MDKNLCQSLSAQIPLILKEAFKHTIFNSVEFTCDRLVYDDIGCDITIRVGSPVKALTQLPSYLTDDHVKSGMAITGTPIIYGRNNKRGIIIKRRTKKYLFKDVDNGKEYVIDFSACTIDKSRLLNTENKG